MNTYTCNKCEKCNTVFKTAQALASHLRKSVSCDAPASPRKRLACTACNATFCDTRALNQHKKICEGLEPQTLEAYREANRNLRNDHLAYRRKMTAEAEENSKKIAVLQSELETYKQALLDSDKQNKLLRELLMGAS